MSSQHDELTADDLTTEQIARTTPQAAAEPYPDDRIVAAPGAESSDAMSSDSMIADRGGVGIASTEGATSRVASPSAGSQEQAPTGTSLLDAPATESFTQRWQEIQTRFVDDPPAAVEEADTLVAEVVQALAASFADHKRELESQWQTSGQVDTEELRNALRRYREFFQRLLSA
jgi:hypothetical protein